MYGYVRPLVAELRVGEYERYRAVYCGLCRSLGRVTGQLSRFSLSYDFTFFAAVRMILEECVPEFARKRCFVHPFGERLMAEENPALAFSAAVSAVFVSAKTADDRRDESGFSRAKAVLRTPLTSRMERRALRLLPPDADAVFSGLMEKLDEAERGGCDSADRAAGLFGDALAYAFSLGLEGEAAETARILGRGAGRFVYLCDAAEDLPADVKKGRYNPLYAGWGALALADGTLSPMVKESLRVSVPLGLGPMGEAADTLDGAHPLTPIVRNIVYLGLPAVLNRVLDGRPGGAEQKGTGLR